VATGTASLLDGLLRSIIWSIIAPQLTQRQTYASSSASAIHSSIISPQHFRHSIRSLLGSNDAPEATVAREDEGDIKVRLETSHAAEQGSVQRANIRILHIDTLPLL
jgi:hypothetical protein